MKYRKIDLLYLALIFSILIIGLFYFNIDYALEISILLVGIEAVLLVLLQKQIKESLKNTEKKLTYIDNLTSLPNRDKFFLDLKDAKAVILIDLDDFSLLNLVYSREFGDQFLKKLSKKIYDLDVVENLYRIGGDEFTIISKEDKDLKYITEKILKTINDFYLIKDNVLVQVTATISVSYSEPFIEKADMALKYAKKHKLNYIVYSKALNIFDENKKFADMAMRLRKALKLNQVIPFFHCIKDKEEKTVRYEALMRVKDGEKYILPELFMDVAKEARLYTELTFQMLTKTFEYMKDKNISFSININYDNITNKRIFNKIIEELDNYPFPQNVVFEFVEIEKVDNIDYLKYFIEKIHKRDAKIAIDNFGGGYNNFVFLEQLDVDIIKISGDIVSRMLSSGNALFMVRNIVEFCKKNNIVSIAEYVSHRDIFMNLKNIGVDEYQGFYFCKPKENIE